MDPYAILFATFAFFLGACIGSFLNVCIYRLPRDLSVNKPKRSFCPSCKYQIPWYRNLPLISWLSLRGKCANCGSPIAFRYFGVELLTGLLFVAVWFHLPIEHFAITFTLWVFVALLVVATFIDFEHLIIPDEITWGGAIAGVLLNLILAPFALPLGDLGQWFAAISGFALIGGGVWLGLALGGPLKDMRRPSTFFVCSLVGIGMALLVESILGGWTSFSATVSSVLGVLCGYFLLWGVVVAGKLAFGRKRIVFKKPAPFSWKRDGDTATITTDGQIEQWMEFFPDEKAVMRMKCKKLEFGGRTYTDIEITSRYQTITVKGSDYDLNQIETFSGEFEEVFFERDAMGFGDVKFMACIGAFLGWKGVLFTLIAASTVGALVGIVTILIGRREWSAKIPFGPYLSLGALLWVFYGPQAVAWYWNFTHPEL